MSDQDQPRTICVFISPGFRDMQAEYDYLDKFTFPRLSGLCISRGVILQIVDLREKIAGEDTAPEDVLQLSLEELRRSRPYYIGLIGKDYGRVVERLPDELLSRWPLLAQYHGRSTNELEIVCGVLRDEAMYGRGFFYFRDPAFIGIEAQEIREESEQSSHDLLKLDELKQSIRNASEQGICRLRENYRDVVELGAWILDDFQQLIDKLWPAPERSTEVKPYDDDVMFTVYRPGTVVPQERYWLLAFAHLSERRPDAPADEPDPFAAVQKQAKQILGEKIDEYRESSQDSSSSVPHAGEITFKPFIPGFDFNPSSRSFRWEESVHREEFRMRATTAPDGEVAKGWLRVYLGPLILAQINLSIKVDSKFVSQSRTESSVTESARPLRKVFASYSHKDQAIVERIEEFVNRSYLGIEYLRDVKTLRSGEVWSPRLMEMIREAQAFQLFWSTNSMRSDFVRQEYQYALALRREDFIRPVFWETPFPEKPEDGLPPEELRRLHFENMAQSVADVDPSPARERSQTAQEYGQPISEVATQPKDYVSDKVSVVVDKIKDFQNADRKVSNIKPLLVALMSATTIIAIGIGLWSNVSKRSTASQVSTNANSNANLPFETGEVEGSVRDLAGRPIPGMTVSITNGPEVITDEHGYFFLNRVPAGIQVIELSSPSGKGDTQSVRIAPDRTTPVSMIYDSATSKTGLLSITEPMNGDVLEAEPQAVVSGRCDGLKEILGPFEVWVLIRPEHDDSRFWLQHPAAVIDPGSDNWRAKIAFGDTGFPNGRRLEIVAIAVRSPSDLERILSTRDLNRLPAHVISNVVTVHTTDR